MDLSSWHIRYLTAGILSRSRERTIAQPTAIARGVVQTLMTASLLSLDLCPLPYTSTEHRYRYGAEILLRVSTNYELVFRCPITHPHGVPTP